MNLFVIKILSVVIGLSVLGGGVFYIKTLVQNNAVLEATLESTTEAMADYAQNMESEVAGYQYAVTVLSKKYQSARDKRNEQIKTISKADIKKMALKHPGMLQRRINDANTRMLNELETITRFSETTRDAETSKTRTP